MCYSRLPASSFKEEALLWEEKTARSVYFSKKWKLFGQSVGSEWRLQAKYHSFCVLSIYCLKTWCSNTYNSIALSITKL